MKKELKRPPRIFVTKNGQLYIKLNGKYIKINSNLTPKDVMKIVVKYMGRRKSSKKKRSRVGKKRDTHTTKAPEISAVSSVIDKGLQAFNLQNQMQKLEEKQKKLVENISKSTSLPQQSITTSASPNTVLFIDDQGQKKEVAKSEMEKAFKMIKNYDKKSAELTQKELELQSINQELQSKSSQYETLMKELQQQQDLLKTTKDDLRSTQKNINVLTVESFYRKIIGEFIHDLNAKSYPILSNYLNRNQKNFIESEKQLNFAPFFIKKDFLKKSSKSAKKNKTTYNTKNALTKQRIIDKFLDNSLAADVLVRYIVESESDWVSKKPHLIETLGDLGLIDPNNYPNDTQISKLPLLYDLVPTKVTTEDLLPNEFSDWETLLPESKFPELKPDDVLSDIEVADEAEQQTNTTKTEPKNDKQEIEQQTNTTKIEPKNDKQEKSELKDKEKFKLEKLTENSDEDLSDPFETHSAEDHPETNIGLTGFGQKGLYNTQIQKIMKPFEKYGFKGVVALDQIDILIPKIKKGERMSFIMNLDKSNEPGSHWVAVYIDPEESLEYYDSFGENPPESFSKDILYLINQLKPAVYLKFKVNKIQDQSSSSKNCGFFAMKFLIDRYKGVPFKECTGFNNAKKGEKDIEHFKKQYEKFEYI